MKNHLWLLLIAILLPSTASAYPSPLVDLVEAQEPGTWLRANLNTFSSVWTPADQRPSPGGSSPRYVISAWSGGGFDPNTGDFYVWGGDNGTYSGNEVYRWTASSLNWERLSLPSAITFTNTASGKKHWHTVDGTDNSPISGETFDGVVFLPNLNRLAVIGGNAYPGGGLQYLREDGVTRAGPFFFDPSKSDPNKVGGLTGSQANPSAFPDVIGGNMWENRQSIETEAGRVGPAVIGGGATAVTTIDGQDVVFVAEKGIGGLGRLFKYTVDSLDRTKDQWDIVGIMGSKTYSGAGVGAYDPTRNVFLRTARTGPLFFDESTGTYVKKAMTTLMYWELDNPGTSNTIVYIHPDSILGDELILSDRFGMDYDPVSDAYYLWSGTEELWKLTPPETFGPTDWMIERVVPVSVGPTLTGAKFTGVYGKWNYMDGLGAFMGVVHDVTGDVWIYKPTLADTDGGILTVSVEQIIGPPIDGFYPAEQFVATARTFSSVSAQSVPEPAIFALLGIGLFSLSVSGLLKRSKPRNYA